MERKRPKVAVHKFSSCDGCQLSLLDCEDELLQVVGAIDLAYFMEATKVVKKGPYDISIVEGSITTPHEKQRIKQIRKESNFVMTIGACATSGGIQALRNLKDVKEFTSIVYAHPKYIDTLETSTAISDHIKVDFELRGCPIQKYELIEVISALLNNRAPRVRAHSVCVDCKLAGNVCVMVAHQAPCLGPITHSGCNALCPSYLRGCYGCFGPKENCHPENLSDTFIEQMNLSSFQVSQLYRSYNTSSPPFDSEGKRHEQNEQN